MYRRYEPPKRQQNQSQQNNNNNNNYGQHTNKPQYPPKGQRGGIGANANNHVHKNQNRTEKFENNINNKKGEDKQRAAKTGVDLLMEFIPRSIYNSDTKKVLGIFSAEDLLLAALILLLIDGSDEESDNSILIYALLYILIEGHIDLPF